MSYRSWGAEESPHHDSLQAQPRPIKGTIAMDIVTTRSKPGLTIIKPAARLSAQRQYVILTVGLALFIAIVSPFRSEMQDADAWEHHRAIKALVDENFAPGNPTYASDEPSVRYSPYSVALATICRATGIDAYTILTIAGVASWLLLCGDELVLQGLRGACLCFAGRLQRLELVGRVRQLRKQVLAYAPGNCEPSPSPSPSPSCACKSGVGPRTKST